MEREEEILIAISELSERRYFLIGDLKLNKPKIYNYFRSTVPSM